MASSIKLKGKKRAVVDNSPLPSPVDNEPPHPTKRVKRAETRRCPVCDEAVPLRLLAKHAEIESERIDEILSKIGSSDVDYESDCEPGPSSRTRRSTAIKARKSILTRSTRHHSVEQTDKTIQAVKRRRKQRHAKLKEMTKEDEEGDTIRDSWMNGITGRDIVCPVCSVTVRGDEDVVNAHVDACLAHESHRQEEVRQRGLQHQRAVEEAVWGDYGGDESPGNYVGHLRGAGFHTRSRNEQDVEEELDIEGDDQAVYGEAQFTEGDVLLVHTEREGPINDDFQVNIEDDGEDEVQAAQQTLHDLVSQSALETRKRVEERASRREKSGSSSELDSLDSAVVAARHRRDTAGLLITTGSRAKLLESTREGPGPTPALLCRICLEPYSEPTVSTGCWHTCCRECWLRCLGSTKLCPICKRITCATNLRRIYL